MCSRCRERGAGRLVLRAGGTPALACLAIVLALLVTGACRGREGEAQVRAVEARRVLRVCADPNNLPFSNERQEGFENRLASLLARDLHADLAYTWWAQRRGFIRNTLRAGACDVVMGLPSGFEMAATTRPYYRSTYVFVSRADRSPGFQSFDDPRLRRVRVGVQIIGDDYANAPPAHALANRRIVSNVVGYPVYGDYSLPDPPRNIIDGVVNGSVAVAIAWGPLAGYFAARSPVLLRVTPVTPQIDAPFLPFVFDIAMGVRRKDAALKAELDAWILRRRVEIDQILAEYHVPRADRDPAVATASGSPSDHVPGSDRDAASPPAAGAVPNSGGRR